MKQKNQGSNRGLAFVIGLFKVLLNNTATKSFFFTLRTT